MLVHYPMARVVGLIQQETDPLFEVVVHRHVRLSHVVNHHHLGIFRWVTIFSNGALTATVTDRLFHWKHYVSGRMFSALVADFYPPKPELEVALNTTTTGSEQTQRLN